MPPPPSKGQKLSASPDIPGDISNPIFHPVPRPTASTSFPEPSLPLLSASRSQEGSREPAPALAHLSTCPEHGHWVKFWYRLSLLHCHVAIRSYRQTDPFKQYFFPFLLQVVWCQDMASRPRARSGAKCRRLVAAWWARCEGHGEEWPVCGTGWTVNCWRSW